MCFCKITKSGMLQYGILGLQKGGSNTQRISRLQHQTLEKVKRSKNLGMLDGSLVINRKCDHKVNQVLILITSLQEQHNQLLWHL